MLSGDRAIRGIVRKASEYIGLREQNKQGATRQKSVADQLKLFVANNGYEDDRGHKYYDLPEPIRGVTKLKLERKTHPFLDEERAEELVIDKDLRDRVIRTIEVFDWDELYVLNQEGVITDEELDSLFGLEESFALVTLYD